MHFGDGRNGPRRELRADLARIIDRVADLRQHVIVTRRGKPAAVLIPVDEYEALEETAAILSDGETLAAVEEGLREVERGDMSRSRTSAGNLRNDAVRRWLASFSHGGLGERSLTSIGV